MASPNREYAAGFFPADANILANRSVWSKFFHAKKTLIDSNWTSIDKWINNGPYVEELSSDEEFVVVANYDSTVDSPKCPEVQGNNNLQLYKIQIHRNELTKTLNLIDNYYADIVNERLVKWEKNGLDRLLLPASKKVITVPEKVNDCFDNFNRFKGKLRIKETRTISITRDSGSDSVDTADYIRGARGKGNKSVPTKNKNRLIKKYSYKEEIESNQPYGLKRNKKIVQRFPLDSDSDIPNENKKSKKKSNESHYPLNDSESSSRHSTIKMKRKRLQRQSRVVESRSHSSSSTDNICFRGRNANFNSRSVSQLNRKHISSDDSDPDDRILDKVRKTYKKPLQILDSQNTLNETAQPIIEFPTEPELTLVPYDTKKSMPGKQIVITNSSDEDSEEDFIFMSNKKRLRLYGVNFAEEPNNCQSLVKYNRGSNIQNNSDGSSTDDILFKIKNYET